MGEYQDNIQAEKCQRYRQPIKNSCSGKRYCVSDLAVLNQEPELFPNTNMVALIVSKMLCKLGKGAELSKANQIWMLYAIIPACEAKQAHWCDSSMIILWVTGLLV